MSRFRTALLMAATAVLTGATLGGVTTAQDASLSPPPDVVAPCASPIASPAGQPIVVNGTQHSGNTAPFDLLAGDYAITVTGKVKDSTDNVILHLVSGDYEEPLFNELPSKGPYTFTTYEYGIAEGSYHLDVTMPAGQWTVTFAPQ